jgi:hypothetical protein
MVVTCSVHVPLVCFEYVHSAFGGFSSNCAPVHVVSGWQSPSAWYSHRLHLQPCGPLQSRGVGDGVG